jgi:hypothetical protein
MTTPKKYDVFVCHASEDKESFVDPLATALKNAGVKVWYDQFVWEWGDTLRGAIDRGLVESRYGIVVFSPAFLKRKKWTEHELDGLFAREQSGNKGYSADLAPGQERRSVGVRTFACGQAR